MSWLFGKKKKEAPKPQISQVQQKEFNRQAQSHKLNQQIAKLDQETDVLSAKLIKMEAEVKRLVKAKKKKQALRKLQEVKMRREQLAKKENTKTFLIKTKIQFETNTDTVSLKDTLKGVNKMMEEGREANDELMEEMENIKEFQDEQKEADEMLKELMGPDEDEQDELNDLYAEMEQEIADEAMDEFDQVQPGVIHPTVQQNTVQEQPQQHQSMEDELNALLS